MIGHAIRVQRLLEAERNGLVQENRQLRQELKERYDFRNIVGQQPAHAGGVRTGRQVARTNTTVLIRGESGTGKEMIAHAVH